MDLMRVLEVLVVMFLVAMTIWSMIRGSDLGTKSKASPLAPTDQAELERYRKMFRALSELQQSKKLCDADLILDDGTKFPIHRLILALGSRFFLKLFTIEEHKDVYTIGLVSSEAMEQICSYMYSGTMTLTERNV